MRRRDEKFPENGFEDGGGYMQVKIAKLEAQFSSCAGKEVIRLSNIFNGVSIYVNGFTKPSAEELKELMAQHGGVYHTYQRSNDYIIASNLPDTKVKNMSLSKVVKPEWISDSIAANSLLDYRKYLLYKNSRTQPQLNFNKLTATNIKTDESHIKDEKDNIELNLKYNNSDKQINEMLGANTNVSTTDTKPALNKVNTNDCIAKTAVDPNFISEFYNNSRLHHISQLGAFFKQHVNDLRDASDFSFPARATLKSKILSSGTSLVADTNFDNGKVIIHIDMDCFFVSVGLRKRPELRGKPVAVTHSKGSKPQTKREGVDRNTEFNLYKQKQAKKLGKVTGIKEDEIVFESRVDNVGDEDSEYGSLSEIASCSYEARAKGIKNGMFMGPALKLCPNLQTIPYDFDGYKEVAYTLYNTIAQYTLDIEAVSCDEMYVDCTELLKDLKVSVQDFATALREEIKDKTGCPCSTGFGSNRLQSRLATKRAKPDGQFFLTSDLVEDFMFGITLKDLPGVGRQTSQKLESLGHQTCGSLQTLTLGLLQRHLGNKTGAQLFDQCRGRDPNPLTFHTIRKSVSAEVNYGIRFETNDQCFLFLKQLSAEVHSRMQHFKVLGKCITLKLMVRAEEAPVETAKFMGHGFCNVLNKSTNLTNATNDVEIITKEVISLCKKQKINPKELRGTSCDVKNQIKVEDNTKNPVTPKKKSISLSMNKSPKHGIKSSPVKRRGRPPKSLKNSLTIAKSGMDKFLAGEIQVKEELPVQTVPEIIQDEKPKRADSNPDGLMSLSWEKVRELLRAWLDSGQAPKLCDTRMIATYLSKLVAKKDIDKVYILMNFLKRRTHEIGLDIWIEVYNYVLEDVQNSMIAVYGKKLWINN
ncbi:DNA repair protein REV1 [Papilio xuthus]|uniref:DNA repair protein REV1 n=1 Tax=Papilio xuthus TaxID=66420 RepID=A0A194PIA3_PAPXU|nr:DNA repair protein REV1 [Papilio xuthus]